MAKVTLKRVFVSHPLYSEGTVADNMCNVDVICRELLQEGVLPVSPLHLFGYMEGETTEQRAAVLNVCKDLIGLCDELYSYGSKGGCGLEINWAKMHGVPIKYKGV